jgi:hypothetical protein
MANHKRRHSHRQVKCTLCTKWSWLGNSKERHGIQVRRQRQQPSKEERRSDDE